MPKWPPSSRKPSTSRPPVEVSRPGAVARALILVVHGYRLTLAPVLPGNCRFAPSCSAFALEAIQRHGASRGAFLTIRRVARCHPWSTGGYDPVPAE